VDGDPNIKKRMVTIGPKDLIGRIFLKDSEDDGQRFRACVVCAVVDREEKQKKGSEYMKFICEVPNSMVDEIFTYNDVDMFPAASTLSASLYLLSSPTAIALFAIALSRSFPLFIDVFTCSYSCAC
jgi:hypothetical protein